MASVSHNTDLLVEGDVFASNLIVKVEAGSTAGTARPSDAEVVYWFCDDGTVPTNAIAGDLVFTRDL